MTGIIAMVNKITMRMISSFIKVGLAIRTWLINPLVIKDKRGVNTIIKY